MTARRIGLFAFCFLALASFIHCSTFVVDETQYVILTEFGKIIAVHGDEEGETGLHFKLPWQSVIAIDRRLQVFDPPPREVITIDKRNLEVASYVVWKVNDPARFLQAAGTLEAAEARINERVSSALSNAIGKREMTAIAATDPKIWGLDGLTEEVVESVAPRASKELGVEIVDIRLRRFNHPVEVRPAIFDLIRSERKQVAAALRAEGEAEFQTLTSQADRRRDAILAKSDAEAEGIRGQGEAEAVRLYNAAHSLDPKFAEFLRTLETYRAILDEKTTIVLSSSSPLLKLLTRGPSDELTTEPAVPPAPIVSSPGATK